MMHTATRAERTAPAERTAYAEDLRIFTVSNLLSPEECAGFIRLAEGRGFEQAPIGGTNVIDLEVRNNGRLLLDDPTLAADLWERLAPWTPRSWGQHLAVGLNERFRFYRYSEGEYFNWHGDGSFVRSSGERSLFTAMIYLNDDFEGGTTDFWGNRSITPRRGMALVFEHRRLHRGAAVTRGCKYVLRTDVMYRLG
ncbi:2OG-Fe(II) oxygenase [Sorangium cellulosum]|uniref:2OG-Fe(II) oxygenase n=1 Tax=Sorangium cellulosum TaxID=56 RepID=A0A2L0EV94_SORCE|nr:2OG-Fe(II) oxygenase [Sorangium cellulosum]AUX43224.1 2OG-Fe(II) oxygenase [Sorangium cellulosum]